MAAPHAMQHGCSQDFGCDGALYSIVAISVLIVLIMQIPHKISVLVLREWVHTRPRGVPKLNPQFFISCPGGARAPTAPLATPLAMHAVLVVCGPKFTKFREKGWRPFASSQLVNLFSFICSKFRSEDVRLSHDVVMKPPQNRQLLASVLWGKPSKF